MPASNATFVGEIDGRPGRLQAGRGRAAAVGLPRRHPRRPRGGGVRRLRGARLERRARAPSCATGRTGRAWCSSGRSPTRTQVAVDIVPEGEVPDGLVPRLRRRRRPGPRRSPWSTRTRPQLRRMAVFDVLVNNADRKGGHVLAMPDGHRYGVDHGVTFHTDPKLRTVLWGWLGEQLTPEEVAVVDGGARPGRRRPRPRPSPPLLSAFEIQALERRCSRLLAHAACCPSPARRVAGHPVAAVLRAPRPVRLPGMRSWPSPEIPTLPEPGPAGVRPRHRHRAASCAPSPTGPARLYVCGITPYDATHLGHAATYVAFDLLNRAWRNAGHEVTYVQNVTDVDDPLLERAAKVHVDWVRAGRARDRAVPPGHGGAAGAPARPLRRRRRVDPAGRSTLIERLRGRPARSTASRTTSTSP